MQEIRSPTKPKQDKKANTDRKTEKRTDTMEWMQTGDDTARSGRGTPRRKQRKTRERGSSVQVEDVDIGLPEHHSEIIPPSPILLDDENDQRKTLGEQ